MTLELPIDLVRRYDRPGPRYTSYPTAPHFTDDFGPEAYRAEVESTNAIDPPAPLSLYAHLPFCRSLCWFCACNVVLTSRRDKIDDYLALLEREIDAVARLFRPGRPVVQSHWGGGTPSYLSPDQMGWLMDLLRRRFTFDPDAEVSVEIDPREVSEAHFDRLAAGGVNRISMGVQDFTPEVQQAIHRIQPLEMTRRAIDAARTRGIESVNIDLIYGLPHQTPASFEKTLDTTLALAPDRIALFNYAHVPWMKKHQRMMRPEDMPGADAKIRILQLAVERLCGAGYVFIGMDHFARPDDELTIAQAKGTLYRNFQGYSTRAGADLVGLGITSIGSVGRTYSQNVKEIPAYRERIEAGELPVFRGYRLTDDDVLRRHVITRLMCDFGLDFADVERKFGIEFEATFADALEDLRDPIADGLVERTPRGLAVTWPGRFLIRNLCMPFDRYLRLETTEGRYSRTV